MTEELIRFDCRYYIGEKPCKFKRECPGCPHYSPMGTRILIIKLRAIGDVLRTTPVLTGLKKVYPESHITWLVDKASKPILENNQLIDHLVVYDLDNVLILLSQEFDLVVSLEKGLEAAALAMQIKAREKMGFGLSPFGTLNSLNTESEYALRLGISDNLKFKQNELSYPEIIFEMVGLRFDGEEYIIHLKEDSETKANEFAGSHTIHENDFIIGLNTGAGPVFASKKWTVEGFIALTELIHQHVKAKILLYGGPLEIRRNQEIMKKSHANIIDTGCENSIQDFCSLIGLCNLLVTADTMAMHIAIALKKNVIAIIGSTCEQEIYLYGRGSKIVSGFDCSPCYLAGCIKNETCMEAISAEQVFNCMKNWIPPEYLV